MRSFRMSAHLTDPYAGLHPLPTVAWMPPVDSMRTQLKEYLKDFDPDVHTDEDAAELVVWFSDISRSATAGMLMAARRVETSGLHKREGHKEAGSGVAGLTGESVGQAASELETQRRAEAHPVVSKAIRSGPLSGRG